MNNKQRMWQRGLATSNGANRIRLHKGMNHDDDQRNDTGNTVGVIMQWRGIDQTSMRRRIINDNDNNDERNKQ